MSCCKSFLWIIYMILTVIAIIGFSYSIEMYQMYNDYTQTTCEITNVTYPTSIHTMRGTLSQRCSCGKKCSSNYPCIRLYIDDDIENNPDNYIRFNTELESHSCTFRTQKCRNGNITSTQQQYVNTEAQRALAYIGKTIPCYKNFVDSQDPIYLHVNIDYHYQQIVVFSDMLATLGMLLMLYKLRLIVKHYRKLYTLRT